MTPSGVALDDARPRAGDGAEGGGELNGSGAQAGQGRRVPRGLGLALLVLAAVGAAVRGPLEYLPEPDWLASVRPVGSAVPSLTAMTPGSVVTGEVPVLTWVAPALWAVLGLTLVVFLVLGLRRVLLQRRGRTGTVQLPFAPGVAAPVAEAPDLAEPIARARELLRGTGRPRDAVISAWVALEEGAGSLGAVREPSETPTEYTEHVLTSTAADRAAVARLRERYLAARFGTDPVTPQDVEQASAALERIQATWSR
ncbi:DUF4129 domain-containing protein [Salana multivorans]